MKKALTWLDEHLEETIMITLLALMVVIMGLQVFMRYVMKNSLSWPEELVRYFFIWFVFLGISYGVRHDAHIKVDILETLIPKIKPVLNVLQDIIFLCFCIMMLKPARNGIGMLVRTNQTSPAMEIPMYYVYYSLYVGFILTIFRLAQKYLTKLIKYLRKNKNSEEVAE